MSKQVGAPFFHRGQEVVAVAALITQLSCQRCTYRSDTHCGGNPPCTPAIREDGERVYFLPIEEYITRRLKGEL